MKELTIEEKYELALEKAMKLYERGTITESLSYLFPELKESEDERIRKGIIRNLEYLANRAEGFVKDDLKEKISWLEKQGQEKHLSEPIKDYQGSFGCWNNAHDFRPKHLQRCICYDKYMKGVYCYVYDDISKYWCTQTTEEHDPDGDNHICDYADYRVTVWMPLPNTSFYPSKSWLEKQGEQNLIMAKSPQLGEQKSAWSEEDEQIILSIEQAMNCASLLNIVPEKMDKIRTWLKSLKQRIGG